MARGFLVASLVTMETPFSVGSTPTNCRSQGKIGDEYSFSSSRAGSEATLKLTLALARGDKAWAWIFNKLP